MCSILSYHSIKWISINFTLLCLPAWQYLLKTISRILKSQKFRRLLYMDQRKFLIIIVTSSLRYFMSFATISIHPNVSFHLEIWISWFLLLYTRDMFKIYMLFKAWAYALVTCELILKVLWCLLVMKKSNTCLSNWLARTWTFKILKLLEPRACLHYLKLLI